MNVEQLITEVAEKIRKSSKTIALTGAGLSAESGIPTFRGRGGLWEKYDPQEYAHIDAFRENPAKCWKTFREMWGIIHNAKPNPGHTALAKLEEKGYLYSIITQNVDRLHQKAGSENVLELHGSTGSAICLSCRKPFKSEEIALDKLPPRCECGGILKPNVILFGEPLPMAVFDKAKREAKNCELMLVIGTSAVVYPASNIPLTAKNSGAEIVEVNPQRTPLSFSVSDYLIECTVGEAVLYFLEKLSIEK